MTEITLCLKRIREEIKLNGPGRQKLEGGMQGYILTQPTLKEIPLQSQHAMLYSDLLHAERELLKSQHAMLYSDLLHAERELLKSQHAMLYSDLLHAERELLKLQHVKLYSDLPHAGRENLYSHNM